MTCGKIENVFDYHNDGVYCVLHIPPNILVSASHDKRIHIYDLEKNKIVHVIKDSQGSVNYIVRENDNSFISCSDDGHVRGHTVLDNFDCKKFLEISFQGKKCHKVQRLSLTKFVVAISKLPLTIFDSRSGKIVKKLNNYQKTSYRNIFGLVKSKIFSKCFYISSLNDDNVLMINWGISKTVGTFSEHKAVAYDIVCFVDSNLNEILCVGSGMMVYFYNTKHKTLLSKLEISVYAAPLTLDWMKMGHNHLLFLGVEGKSIEIIKFSELCLFEKDENKLKNYYENIVVVDINGNSIHSSNVFRVIPIEDRNNKLKICSCSWDQTVKICTIKSKHFEFKKDIDPDELERIQYLEENYCTFEIKWITGKVVIFKMLILC